MACCLRIADDRRAAAVREHDRALGHGVDGVVGAFAVHVGLEQRQQPLDGRIAEDDDIVDAAQRADQLRTIGGRQNRPARRP